MVGSYSFSFLFLDILHSIYPKLQSYHCFMHDKNTTVTFLSPNKKVTKEIGIGEALSSALPRRKTPSPMYLSRRALGDCLAP